MGKGHWRRPAQVTDEELKEAWKRIFTEPKIELESRSRCADFPDDKTGPYYPKP